MEKTSETDTQKAETFAASFLDHHFRFQVVATQTCFVDVLCYFPGEMIRFDRNMFQMVWFKTTTLVIILSFHEGQSQLKEKKSAAEFRGGWKCSPTILQSKKKFILRTCKCNMCFVYAQFTVIFTIYIDIHTYVYVYITSLGS